MTIVIAADRNRYAPIPQDAPPREIAPPQNQRIDAVKRVALATFCSTKMKWLVKGLVIAGWAGLGAGIIQIPGPPEWKMASVVLAVFVFPCVALPSTVISRCCFPPAPLEQPMVGEEGPSEEGEPMAVESEEGEVVVVPKEWDERGRSLLADLLLL